MNHIIQGNILDITEGVICHQVNCKYKAKSGLALQIRNKYPNWFMEYLRRDAVLGEVGFFQATKYLVIADMYAQFGYGRDKRYTNYADLGKCLWEMRKAKEILYIPYGIGCGLGGGDWNIVREIIFDALPHAIIIKWDGEL